MLRSIPRIIITVTLALGLAPHASAHPQSEAQILQQDPAPRWSPPLMRPLEVSGHYRAPQHKYGPGHRGIDIPASPGEPVIAPASGIVSFAGRVVDRDVITIRVDARTLVSLEPVASGLDAGEQVVRGAPLGTVATGGHCASECVHLGVRIGTEAEGRDYVNPLRFYLDRPVLLPW